MLSNIFYLTEISLPVSVTFAWEEDSDPITLVLIDGTEKFIMVIHLCNLKSYYDSFSEDYDDCYTNYYYLQLGHFEMP